MTEISWQYFPKWAAPPEPLPGIIRAFQARASEIRSADHSLSSDEVLAIVRPDLEAYNFQVERGKKAADVISVPVLYGANGQVEKAFEADAVYRDPTTGTLTVLEVEAGRGYVNHQFLKDLFEACMMQDVAHLAVAVRCIYMRNPDCDRVVQFFETLYSSRRLTLPLDGVLILGY